MISDLDETLKQLLIQKASLNQNEVAISFEAPDREWAATKSKPTVNFYLYDVRENHELRTYEWTIEHNQNKTATRKKAPTRIDLSYAVTVWTKAIEDEHRLLGNIMVTLMRYPLLPAELFQGALKGLEYPIHASTAQPDSLLKSPADFWTALDNKLKPSINYVITMPIDLDIAVTAPLVTMKAIEVKEKEKDEIEEILQIGGLVYRKTKPEAGIADVAIVVKEAGLSARSDASGHYKLAKIKRGTYTFQVSMQGKPARDIEIIIPGENYNIEL